MPELNHSVIEVMHHNRDREAILAKLLDCDKHLLMMRLDEDDLQELCQRAMVVSALMQDDACINMGSIQQYLNMARFEVEKEAFTPTVRQVEEALSWVWPTFMSDQVKSWLIGRGVTEEQIRRHHIFDAGELTDDEAKTLGVTIHPALQDWVGQRRPVAAVIPAINIDGQHVGAFVRCLSTVPKLKFSGALPGLNLFTDIRSGHAVKDIYLCEGVFDALALEHADPTRYYVSPSSGYFSAEQLMQLAWLIQDVYPRATLHAWFDSDRVGIQNNLLTHALWPDRTILYRYPEGPKDLSELVHKYKLPLSSIYPVEAKELMHYWKSLPKLGMVDYDHYLSERQAAYSNDNYRWVTTSAPGTDSTPATP